MNSQISRRTLFQSIAAVSVPAGLKANNPAGAPSDSFMARSSNTYINARKVLIWESTRKEIREALQRGDLKAVIVPTGSSEQHSEHMAMIQDTASAALVAQQAALLLYPQVMVATPVAVGVSPYHMEHKGTLTLRKETFLAVVFDICDSLRMHGVKHVLILNGHGGNLPPLKEALPGFREKLKIDIAAHAYWEAYTPEVVEKYLESGDVPGHAGELETSFAMAAFPERLHEEFHHPVTPEEERNYKEAKLATAAKGEALISIAVNWTADRVRRMLAGAA